MRGDFLAGGNVGKVTAIHAHMYRNTPHGKPQWSRPVYPDMTAGKHHLEVVSWAKRRRAEFDRQPLRQLALLLGLLRRQRLREHVPPACLLVQGHESADSQVRQHGGRRLSVEGRPRSAGHHECLDGAFRKRSCSPGIRDSATTSLGVTEDVLGTRRHHFKSQQIRYTPQKVNRPDGNEMMGETTHALPTPTCRIFLDCIRSGKRDRIVRSIVGFRVSVACRMAVDSYRQGQRRCAGTRRRRKRSSERSVDFEYTPEQIQLRQVRARIRRSGDPASRHGVGRGADLSRSKSIKQAGQARLHGLDLSRGAGRRGPRLHRVLHHHRRAFPRGWLGRASSWPRTPRCARIHIFKMGNDEQRQRYRSKLASGEWIGCWSLTEPEAGSDAAGTRTTAVREGGSWVLERREDVHHQRALRRRLRGHGRHRSHRRAARHLGVHRRKGTPGFRAGKKENKLGLRASATGEVIFDDCRAARSRSFWASAAKASSTACKILDGGAHFDRRAGASAWRRAPTTPR